MGAAADPCRAGRTAGACFASFMGLELKLYLFKKRKATRKEQEGVWFCFGVRALQRQVWAGKLRLSRS